LDKRQAETGGREVTDPSIVVLATAAILDHRKVLIVKEEAEPYHDRWVLPQGYTKAGETLAQAAEREVSEELGSQIEILRLLGVYEDFEKEEGGRHYIIVCYLCRLASHQQIRATPEVIDWAWTDPKKVDDQIPQVFQAILHDISALNKAPFFSLSRSKTPKG
jgi:ADP-ribose pyrophosphatase YjhB (NUDIX family)